MSIDIMDQLRATFRAEAMDLLVEFDSALLSLEEEPGASTRINRVFRAIHTIKGSGAMAGYTHLTGFAHRIEEAFDLAREGRLSVTPQLIDCALSACDIIRRILEDTVEGAAVPGEAEVSSAFAQLLPAPESAPAEPGGTPEPSRASRAAFEILLRPNREIFYSGCDPVTLLDDLRELGQVHITAHADRVPVLSSLEPEQCYLWWEILLLTERDQTAIQEVFIFVEDECELSIRLLEDQAGTLGLLGSLPPEMFDLFAAECEDQLDGMEQDALALEKDPSSRSSLDSLFRRVHSIKGNTGVLLEYVKDVAFVTMHPLQTILRMTHALESVLDSFRDVDRLPVSEESVRTALETCDALRSLLRGLLHGARHTPVDPDLLERLGLQTDAAPKPQSPDPRQAAFRNTISQCIEMIASCLSRLQEETEPASAVIQTYQRGIATWSTAARYQDALEFEEPLAEQRAILDKALTTGNPPSSAERISLQSAFHSACSILDGMDSKGFDAPQPIPGATTQPESSVPAASPSTVRIDQNKLDGLMRVVGELLVARGAIPLLVKRLQEGADGAAVVRELKDTGSNISRIADELQTSVMSIRMLPMKTVFQRFPRLVRDLARSLGKEVRLVIEGESIELDKGILEQIGDPLVHLIRNAVDHGLEPPEQRRAMGKDPTGQLTLRAFHESGGVAIQISDDGRGLDVAALKRKAVEKGLLTPSAAAAMSEEAATQLIFLPGLTTAAKVTSVSGRGVGMDVVHSNVRNLRGTVEIRSRSGRGTTLLIKLPTSLMVSKGILLEAGAQQYILPLTNILDMVKLPREQAHSYRGHTFAHVRGMVYSIVCLATMLGLAPADTAELSVAIVEAGKNRFGLIVDRFLTEVEVLVKPLSGGLEHCKEFQGAAIMGDGRVVLVLNPLECQSLVAIAGDSQGNEQAWTMNHTS